MQTLNNTSVENDGIPVHSVNTNKLVVLEVVPKHSKNRHRSKPNSHKNDYYVQLPALKKQMEQCNFTLDKPNLHSMIVGKNNMEPTYRQNDIVVVDLDHRFSCDGIYLVRLGKDVFICRMQLTLNGYRLINDNPDFPNATVTNQDDYSVIGRVEWKLRKAY